MRIIINDLLRPAVLGAMGVLLAACGLAAAAYGVHAGRSRRDVAVLATVTPIYALGHGVGMCQVGAIGMAKARATLRVGHTNRASPKASAAALVRDPNALPG